MRLKKKVKFLFLSLATAVSVFCGAFCNMPVKVNAMETDGTFKYLAIGNSITVHPIRPFWWGNWGMAATSADKDYVHTISSYIERRTGSVSMNAIYYADWERTSSGWQRTMKLSELDSLLAPDLDLVTIMLGENVTDTSDIQQDFQNLINYIRQKSPNARIIMIGQFWPDDTLENAKRAVCYTNGISFVDLSAIWGQEYRIGMGATVWGADGMTHVISDEGVAQHPNDAAMAYIGQSVNRLLTFDDYNAVTNADSTVTDGLSPSVKGVWYLYQNGQIATYYSGLYYDPTYGWWLVKNGKVDFGYNDLYLDSQCGWWKITNGAVDFDYTDLYYSPTYGWWKITGGTVDFGYNDLYGSPTYGWWKITGGTVDFGFSDLYNSPQYGWWKINCGTVDSNYTDLYESPTYGWWIVNGGAVIFAYNDLFGSPQYGWWKVTGGAVDFGYTGVYESPTYGPWNIYGGAVVF